jgi:ABC-2 type transport system permease protein
VNYLGDPDNGVVMAGYIGSWLMAGAFLAIGACMSTATRSQVIAFILTASVCFVLLLIGQPQVLDFFQDSLPPKLIGAMGQLSIVRHANAIARGVLDLRDLMYFGAMIVAWLGAAVVVLDLKRTR